MKRWLSVSFVLSTFLGVLIVSVFSIYRLRFGILDVPSSPVSAQAASQVKDTSTTGEFTAAETYFRERGITLSTAPKTTLAGVSWEIYDQSNANVSQASNDIKYELSRYSDKTLKSTGLKSIYFVKNMRVGGRAQSGKVDPVTDAMYFDVSSRYLDSENGEYLRRTYHHELSHLIEYNLFGSYAPTDAAWDGCNARGTEYGDGGPSMYSNPDFAHKMHPSFGFIDGYATSGEEEDKAEMFAYYMVKPDYVQDMADKDTGIDCKLTQTENLLQSL